MSQGLLKSILPRGIYGRAILILILPVVVIQLVVSVMFLQRHFDDVTQQMTLSMLREITYVVARVEKAPDARAALADGLAVARPLGIDIALPAKAAVTDSRVFYDLSGIVVTRQLRQALPGLTGVNLSEAGRVRLTVRTRYGVAALSFDRRRVSASNPHQLLVLMALTSVLMTVIALIFLRNQLRPIRRLARAAEAFGHGQTIPYRVSGASEVRAAGAAFLDMRARIERQIESRTMMLSGVSHDLRTPLTRMRLGLSMLSDQRPPDAAEISALEQDVGDMGRLVDAFLAFAREDAEAEEARRVDLRRFLDDIAADQLRLGGDLTLLPPAEGDVVLRPVAMRRAIENLIGNALRYGERARLSVQQGQGFLVLVVEDTGPGIPAERRAEAMRPFSRLDPARNQDRGQGVGLGLAIASDIARSHGGLLRLGDSADLGGLKAEIVVPQ